MLSSLRSICLCSDMWVIFIKLWCSTGKVWVDWHYGEDIQMIFCRISICFSFEVAPLPKLRTAEVTKGSRHWMKSRSSMSNNKEVNQRNELFFTIVRDGHILRPTHLCPWHRQVRGESDGEFNHMIAFLSCSLIWHSPFIKLHIIIKDENTHRLSADIATLPVGHMHHVDTETSHFHMLEEACLFYVYF